MYEPLTIRLTTEEATTFDRAAVALHTTPSALLQSAVVEAAYNLGLTPSGTTSDTASPASWDDAPRRTSSTTTRITVSLDPGSSRLLRALALYLNVSRSQVAIGATLRYVATLKRPRASPLAHVPVPAQYSRP